MDKDFDFYFKRLTDAKGSPDKQIEALKQLAKVAHNRGTLNISKDVFETFTELAMETKNAVVRNASIQNILHLFKQSQASKKTSSKFIDERLVTMCITFIGEPGLTSTCLCILVVILDIGDETIVKYAVSRGAIDILFRLSHPANAGAQMLNGQVREVGLAGLATLAKNKEYAVRLHDKDIWSLLFRLFDQQYITSTCLDIIKMIVLSVNLEQIQHEEEFEDEEANPVSATKKRLSMKLSNTSKSKHSSVPKSRNHSAITEEEIEEGDEEEADLHIPSDLDGEVDETNKKRKSRRPRVSYTEEEGLLSEHGLDESTLDLPCRVCLHIDRKGIMGTLLNICQSQDLEALADVALSILGLLSRTMHRVITRDNRIIIMRVLLNLYYISDSRLISVAYVLDSFVKQPASRSIVLQCGAAVKCATAGIKLLERKDVTSKTICEHLVALLFHISKLSEGATELSNPQCIEFLTKSMKSIASTNMEKNGEKHWSHTTEVVSLIALINIAIESPVISSVAEANIQKALTLASKRGDEIGLLAVLGSAFFVGKVRSRVRSREIPRVHPSLAKMLVALLDKSHRGEQAFADIAWTTLELLHALNYLVQGPHNLNNLRILLTPMIESLQICVDKEQDLEAGLAVEILLFMSYNKYIMKDMASRPELIPGLDASLDLISWDFRRSAETLIVSLENEMMIENAPKAANISTEDQIQTSSASSIKPALRSTISSITRRLSLRKSIGRFQKLGTSAFVVNEPHGNEE